MVSWVMIVQILIKNLITCNVFCLSGEEEASTTTIFWNKKNTKGSYRNGEYPIQAFREAAKLVAKAAYARDGPTWGTFLPYFPLILFRKHGFPTTITSFFMSWGITYKLSALGLVYAAIPEGDTERPLCLQ
jgi:hypothetical protein